MKKALNIQMKNKRVKKSAKDIALLLSSIDKYRISEGVALKALDVYQNIATPTQNVEVENCNFTIE
jgi:hypothetical protein